MSAEVTQDQVRAVLKFASLFDTTDAHSFQPAMPLQENAHSPHHDGPNEMTIFWKVLRENNFIVNFDWPQWQNEAERMVENPGLLNSADLETLRKLLTTHVRKERFSEGHFDAMIRCGHLKAIFARLAEIQGNLT